MASSKAKKLIIELSRILKDKADKKYSGLQKIRINWNQGGITEAKEIVEEKIK